jgi:hypothetical protein
MVVAYKGEEKSLLRRSVDNFQLSLVLHAHRSPPKRRVHL